MKIADVVKVAKSFKMVDAQRFAQHVVPEVVRPARVIWNQAIGAIFLLIALMSLWYAYDYYRQMATDSGRALPFGFSLFFGLVMMFFGVDSFVRARRIASRPRTSGR